MTDHWKFSYLVVDLNYFSFSHPNATHLPNHEFPSRGLTKGKGGTYSQAPIQYGGAESLQGHRITAGGAEKRQQCHKYFL